MLFRSDVPETMSQILNGEPVVMGQRGFVNTWPLVVITVAVIAIALVSIFLYKKRILQMRVVAANELCDLLHGLNVYVNLIPYNEVIEKPYKRSSKDSMVAFFDLLKKRRINVQLRREQGTDIDAACGQLRSKHMKKEF